jgi:hypothetical protein
LYENITDFSNTVEVNTLEERTGNIFRVNNEGILTVLTPSKDDMITVYNILGQKIRSFKPTTNIVEIKDLLPGQIYIVVTGKYRTKIILTKK